MFEVLKDSFAVAFKKPFTYIALIAVPIVVALFGLLYPATFLDPYEQMKDMPVALINKDAGCTVDGEHRSFGDDIVGSIKDNDSVKWTEADASVVDDGIENTDYFMAVVIPEDFSERVAAGQTSDPEQANLTIVKNVRRNFMLSTMLSKAETSLHQTLNGKIAGQYAEALTQGLVNAKDGFTNAADGAGSLTDGLADAQSGAGELSDGLSTLGDGTATLSSGLATLNASSSTLTDGSSQVASGIAQLADGSQTYAQTLSAAQDQVASAFGGNPADSVDAAKTRYAQALQAYTVAVARTTAMGGDPASVDASELSSAVEALAQTAQAAGTYGALAQAQSGYAQLDQGISTLGSSYTQLDQGIATYTQAVGSLSAGAASAVEGTAKLQQGSNALGEGLGTAVDGSRELTDGLSDGAQTISDAVSTTPEQMSDYVSDPTAVDDDNYGDLDKFGYGFIPLFNTMCLWLGGLIIFFVFDPFPSRRLQGSTGRVAAIVGRWPAYLVFSVVEAAVVCLCAYGLGVPFQDPVATVALYACLAFSFMCIMQLFNLFDIIGKALSVLLLIVQLVCCSGTLPAQLGSGFASAVGPFLPFYYSIDAFRELMSGAHVGVAYADMGMLLLFAAGAAVLSIAVYPAALRFKDKRERMNAPEPLAEAAA